MNYFTIKFNGILKSVKSWLFSSRHWISLEMRIIYVDVNAECSFLEKWKTSGRPSIIQSAELVAGSVARPWLRPPAPRRCRHRSGRWRQSEYSSGSSGLLFLAFAWLLLSLPSFIFFCLKCWAAPRSGISSCHWIGRHSEECFLFIFPRRNGCNAHNQQANNSFDTKCWRTSAVNWKIIRFPLFRFKFKFAAKKQITTFI